MFNNIFPKIVPLMR